MKIAQLLIIEKNGKESMKVGTMLKLIFKVFPFFGLVLESQFSLFSKEFYLGTAACGVYTACKS